jgi:DmsE family decaheme c-type cytochrome
MERVRAAGRRSVVRFAVVFVFFSLVAGNAGGATEAPRSASTVSAQLSGYSEKGADTCLACHNDESMLLIFRTPHGQGSNPDAPFAHLQCESCHGPGGEHTGRKNVGAGHPPIVNFGRRAEAPVEEQNKVCMNCHSKDVGIPWTGSAHQRNQIACADCHQVHATVDPVSLFTEQADVCFACHQKQRADSFKPSAHPIRFGVMTCTACHSPHHAVGGALVKQSSVNKLCWSCHAELRGPYLFEHPPVSENCLLCHYAHGSIHEAMLTKRPPLLCQSCHSQRGHPSVSYTPNSLAGNRPSAFVVNGSCLNCHSQVHGSNHPSGSKLMR